MLGVALALALVSAAGAVWRLGLNSNQDALVSVELPYHQRYMEFVEDFGDLELLFVVIDQKPDPVAARRLALEVESGLRAQPQLFEQVHARFRAADFGDTLLLLPAADAFLQVERRLNGVAAELGPLSRIARFDALLDHMSERMGAVTGEEDAWADHGLQFVDALIGELELADAGSSAASGAATLIPSLELPESEGFQESGRYLLVSFLPQKDYGRLDPVEESLAAAREVLESARKATPTIEAGITGRAALSADEMQTTSWDMTLGAILGVVGVTAVFVFFFRRLVRPLLAVLSLILAIGWTFGLTTVTLGSLNLLSSVFAIVLVGVGVDFGVHVLARYQSELSTSGNATEAVRVAVLHAGRGNLVAALTTVTAFYAAMFTDFQGLAELGFVAGSGVLFCLLSMLLVFPAALYRLDGRRFSGEGGVAPPPLPRLEALERLANRPGRVLVLALALTAAGGGALPAVRFNENLLELQAPDEDSVIWERRLLEGSELSSWTTASLVDTPQDARARHLALEALPDVVAKVESVASFELGTETDRRGRIARIAAAVGELNGPGGEPAVDGSALDAAIERHMDALADVAERAVSRGVEGEAAVDQLFAFQDRLEAVREGLPGRVAALGVRQQAFFDGLHGRLRALASVLHPPAWSLETIPVAARRHLVGASGKLAVHVFPEENVWDPAAMERFLTAVRTIDPDVTGATVSVHESGKVMLEAFWQVILATLCVVSLVLLVEYRGPLAFMALVPLGVGTLWLLEVMGATGLTFNMANFFAIPVLIGIGVDDGVHMINRHLEDPHGPLASSETGLSVILTSLTTMIAFGALATASHRGMASFGLLMAVGAFVLMLSAVVLLPALLRLFFRSGVPGSPEGKG